jgi:hypothetical protein
LSGDFINSVKPIILAFENLNISYCLIGSHAKAIRGGLPPNGDIELVATLSEADVADFSRLLGGLYYVSVDGVLDPVKEGRPFYLLHMATATKIGILSANGRPSNLFNSAEKLPLDSTQPAFLLNVASLANL